MRDLCAPVAMIASAWYLSCWLDMIFVGGMAEMLGDILEAESTKSPDMSRYVTFVCQSIKIVLALTCLLAQRIHGPCSMIL